AVEREKGKFRSFLLAALNHFLANERDRVNAAKRGGGKPLISLDDETAEGRYAMECSNSLSAEKLFERRWALALLEQALIRVHAEFVAAGKTELFERLKEFLADSTERKDYKDLAAQLGMTPNSVAVAVHRLRHR